MLFKELILSIIPDEIKQKQTLFDSISIVLEYIEENNNFSYDINNIFTEDNPVIKDALVGAYLENLKSAYEKALVDDNINKRLIKSYEQLGMQYEPTALNNISDILNEEYIYTSKEFKQKKGTIPAIEYAYNAIRQSKIQAIDVNTDLQDRVFKVIEGTPDDPTQPFFFQVEGSLYKEVYENAVKPIVHPVGFGYFYSKLAALFFDELVNVILTYPNTIVKVVCTASGSVLDYSHIPVVSITEEKDEYLNKKIVVVFNNNTKLVREFNTTVTLQDLDGNILQDFPDYCALFLQYTPVFTSTIQDNLSLTELFDYDTEYIGYEPSTLQYVGNMVIGSFDIGGMRYVGFITDSYFEELIQEDELSLYYDYVNSPILLGSEVVIGDRYQWKIGSHATSTVVEGETYSTSVEIEETFVIETIPGDYIIDGGFANSLYAGTIDGGVASTIPSIIINGGGA